MGYYDEDNMHGYGKLIFKNGDSYLGEFKNNHMHDENATISYANGDVYTGSVASDKKHSKLGEYAYSNVS